MFTPQYPLHNLSTDGATANAPYAQPCGRGPHAVGSTNFEVALESVGQSAGDLHDYLIGFTDKAGRQRFIGDVLKYPKSALVTRVTVPELADVYGPASCTTLPVATFVTYPSSCIAQPSRYEFPYHDSAYGSFEHMLKPSEAPEFADPRVRYPLIILSHGASSHGVYDIKRAHDLASHGYVVAVINYGDDRIAWQDNHRRYQASLRPLLTKAVLDTLLDSEVFSAHIDAQNIGIAGHSFGGMTALALAGGRLHGQAESVSDERIKACAVAAPWVGGIYDGSELFVFGTKNKELSRVTAPTLCCFGSKDEDALASFVLPAMDELSGARYVVELVDQPHVFEPESWADRYNWELLFFSAYLKGNSTSLETLRTVRSIRGGGLNTQLFDYQA